MEQNLTSHPEIEMYQLDLEELEKLILISNRPNIKRQLQTYKTTMEKTYEEEKRRLANSTSSKIDQANTSSTNTQEKMLYSTITKYSFDNSGDKFVKIYLTENLDNLKTIDPSNIISKFTKKSFEVVILNWNKKNYKFANSNLCKEIDADGSYCKPTSSGLVIYLKKAKISDYWESLEKKKSLTGNDEDAEVKTEDKNKDPSAGLMDMMREMYQSGDPEMKRIIAEAWTKSQSGGTGI